MRGSGAGPGSDPLGGGRLLASAVLSVLAALAVALLSQWPVAAASEAALVRLSWRTEPIRAEACRTLSEEELAAIPAHMRRAQECTGGFVDYELVLEVDGRTALVDTLSPSGLRRDRPVYVLHDIPVEPGVHFVEIDFTALVPPDFDGAGPRGDVADPDRQPLVLEWSGEMSLAEREVGLVTLDAEGRRLERRGGA